MNKVNLREIDRVEITVLVDNYTDLLLLQGTAVLGGFHLTGPAFDPIIKPTIEGMKKIGPDYIAPTHCTGWKAVNEFAREMPDPFLLNCVGTTYVFESA